jgi:hypothetical protein
MVGASDETKSGLKTGSLSRVIATLRLVTRMLGGGQVVRGEITLQEALKIARATEWEGLQKPHQYPTEPSV